MSEVPYSETEYSAIESGSDKPPSDLPPVEPPSARFIIQLFVVPGVIVLAIIGMWALFGKLTANSQDWRTLVTELRSTNEHRRWRGAFGLAQMLDLDVRSGGTDQSLASNRQIATELAALTREQLGQTTKSEDDLKQLAFLAKTLGLLDSEDLVIPVLQAAMQPEQDRDIRKNAIASIALIADRSRTASPALSSQTLTNDLIEASRDSDALVKHVATFTLGLLTTDAAQQQLLNLLKDRDPNTRINAAIGLCRQESTAGLAVFKQVLSDAGSVDQNEKQAGSNSFEQQKSLENSLRAIGELADRFNPTQRQELTALVETIVREYPHGRIRVDAANCLNRLAEPKRDSSPHSD